MLDNLFIQYATTEPRFFFAVIITVVVSICIHELSHGVVAIWLGDRTPIETEHMTLNPLVHMGGLSIITLFVAGIAWGAMPVDRTRLRGRYAGSLVALAGPVSNVVLALLGLTAMALWRRYGDFSNESQAVENGLYLLLIFGRTNFALAVFNLIPVPPLDGSNILAGLSPSLGQTMNSIRQAGMGLFMIVFLFAGTFIWKAADWLTFHYVHLLTRHRWY
jgi:Zn-dependent protease